MDEPIAATPAKLEYAPPDRRPSTRAYHLLSGATCLALWFALLLAFSFIVPRFEYMYRAFKMELPGMTKAILVAARLFSNGYGATIAFLACVGIFAGGLVTEGRADNTSSIRRYALAVMALAVILLIVLLLMVFALCAPMIPIGQSVSGNP